MLLRRQAWATLSRFSEGREITSLAVVAVVMALAFYRFTETVADPDIWGHLAIGGLYYDTGHIRQTDPFSYVTGGREWMNHEWLTEVILSRLFSIAGPTGLIVLKAALGLAVLGIIYVRLCRRGLSALRAGIIVVAVIHFLTPFFITVRPHLATFALLFVMLLMIDALDRDAARWLWTVPLIFALWANLHPGFLVGLGVLWIYTVIEFTTRWLRSSTQCAAPRGCAAPRAGISRVIAAAVGAVVATGVNPWGFKLLGFLWHTATVPRPEITEWQPLTLMSREGLSYAAFVTAAFAGWHWSRRRRRLSVLAVLVACSLLPLMAYRHVALAVLAIATLAGEHMGDAWIRLRGADPPAVASRRAWDAAVVVTSCVLATFALSGLALPRLSCIAINRQAGIRFPVPAVEWVRASGVRANAAVEFDWGMYALYRLWPNVKVSLDGRRETAYDERVYKENLDFKLGQGDWEALLRTRATDLALVRRGVAADNLLRLKAEWVLLYEDALAALFAREGHGIARRIRATPRPSSRYDGAEMCVS
jgi:hypothetical protein